VVNGIPATVKKAITSVGLQRQIARLLCGVARFFLTQYTKTKENIPNYHFVTKRPQNIPNDRKTFQMKLRYASIFYSKPIQNLPKMGFLVRKQNHLASLLL
jgi:hypothetical protein